MKEQTVIGCGTEVETIMGGIKAMITGVCVRFDKVTYEIGYFKNGEYETCWLHEAEFTFKQSDKTKISYK